MFAFFVKQTVLFVLFRHKLTLPVFLDQERSLYSAFGLGRRCSLLGLHTVDQYAGKILRNEPFPPAYAGDDLFLMGGDFILDKNGVVIYQYATKETERPSVDEILSALNL